MSIRVNGGGHNDPVRMTPEEKTAFKKWREEDIKRLKKIQEEQKKATGGCNKCRRNKG